MSGDDVGLVVVVVIVIGVSLAALFVLLGSFVGLPLLLKKRIATWTQGPSSRQAWGAIEQGATRGFFQFFPATFLEEQVVMSPRPLPQALEHVASIFASGWGRKVHLRDAEGIVVSVRYLPFLATDIGWVGVVLAQPQPQGTALHIRFRTTYMLPVFTFFLGIRLRIYYVRLFGR
jgi:hypothetical protein